MSTVSRLAWWNGALVERERAAPSVASNSFHLGTGVFDGLMAYWNEDHHYVHLEERHLSRFIQNAGRMGMDLRVTVAELSDGIRELLATCEPSTHYLRPIAYRKAPELMLLSDPMPAPDACVFAVPVTVGDRRPLSLTISDVERVASAAIPVAWKICGAYVNSVLAQMRARQAGFDGALLLDHASRITEAAAANVFFIAGDTLVTPPTTRDIFPGLTRASLMESAAASGIAVIEEDVTPADLARFSGAFLCSTLMEMRPVADLAGQRWDTSGQDVWDELERSFGTATAA